MPLIELLLYLLRNVFLHIVLLKRLNNPQKGQDFTTQHSKYNQTQKQNPKRGTIKRERYRERESLKLTATAISTASFCMSGIISALLMMTFFGGTAGTGAGFGSSELGLAVRAPAKFFLASSLISLSLSLSDSLSLSFDDVAFWGKWWWQVGVVLWKRRGLVVVAKLGNEMQWCSADWVLQFATATPHHTLQGILASEFGKRPTIFYIYK